MHNQINANIISEIKAKANIVEVISEQVRLQKKGKYYFGRCPFHLEDTPSFSVSQEKQMYYCFGCHAGGDVISFLMETQGLTFMQAVESLADRYSIVYNTTEMNAEEKKHLEEREKLFSLHSLVTGWFIDQLFKTEDGKIGLAYLKKRNLTPDIIKKFQIGFAPPAWDKLSNYLLTKGISKELLLKAGFSIKAESGSSLHDRFRNRIIFPIHDYRGRVVAFGGRIVDDTLPKYLNSAETPIFSKSHNLYGLWLASQTIRHSNSAILVEGYMDVVSCHQYGISNAVASLGTALTAEQGKLLLRYTDKIFFGYDSDNAGIKAIQKGIFTLGDLGLHIKVLKYPDAKDPDEYLQRHKLEDFNNLIDNAQTSFVFLLETALINRDIKDAMEKSAALQEIFPYVSKVQDNVVREEYLKHTAFTLNVSESAIFTEFRKFQKNLSKDVNFSDNFGKNTHVTTKIIKNDALNVGKQHGKILALAIEDPILRTKISNLINFPFSENENEEKLLALILDAEEENSEELITSLPDEWQAAVRYILFNEKFALEGKETLEDIIFFLRKQYIKRRLEEINALLAHCNFSAGISTEIKTLLSERQLLQSQLKQQPLRGGEK